MAASSFKSSAQYQRERRALLKRKGYRRVELEVSPKLMARLMPHIGCYSGQTHPGAAIVQWLDEILPDEPKYRNKMQRSRKADDNA